MVLEVHATDSSFRQGIHDSMIFHATAARPRSVPLSRVEATPALLSKFLQILRTEFIAHYSETLSSHFRALCP